MARPRLFKLISTFAVLVSLFDHKSFLSISGKIKFSKDFTGENRTDDRYGHGTYGAVRI